MAVGRGDLGDRDAAKKRHSARKAQRKRKVVTRKKAPDRAFNPIGKGGPVAGAAAGAGARVGRRDYEYTEKRVITTVKVVPAIVEKPRTQAVASVIPTATEHPTVSLVGMAEAGTGGKIPWSVNPNAMGLPFINDVIGTLLVVAGTKVLAAMASKISGAQLQSANFTVGSRIQLKVDTGRGAGRGRYTRPRAEGGELPDDDADPYEQPSEWWEFWKWSF